MQELERFTHCGDEYIACAEVTASRVYVTILKDGKRVNGNQYFLEREVISDAWSAALQPDLVKELAKTAISDFCTE